MNKQYGLQIFEFKLSPKNIIDILSVTLLFTAYKWLRMEIKFRKLNIHLVE